MTMIFQDPYASLNPRKRVGFIIGEPLEVHGLGSSSEIKRRVQELLEVVGLNPEHYNRFPHEFSGGQRQRIGVARAPRRQPEADRLRRARLRADVSVQAQILNLPEGPAGRLRPDVRLHRPRSERRPAHLGPRDGDVPRQGCGGSPRATCSLPRAKHPYTGALLSAVPIANPELGRSRQPIVLEGDVPSPVNPPSACNFHPRCPRFVEGHCDVDDPPLYSFGNGHVAACHYPLERWPMNADEIRRAGERAKSEHPEQTAAGVADARGDPPSRRHRGGLLGTHGGRLRRARAAGRRRARPCDLARVSTGSAAS